LFTCDVTGSVVGVPKLHPYY